MPDLTQYVYDIFLSHSNADMEWVSNLTERLEQKRWKRRKLKVFFSPRDLRPGEDIPKRIGEALSLSRYVGIVLTPNAMKSSYVEFELQITLNQILNKKRSAGQLIPILLIECEVPVVLEHISHINFTDASKFENSYKKLVAVIKGKPLELVVRRASPSAGDPIPRLPTIGFVPRYNDKKQDVLALVKEELAPGKNQLVALWGPGGMGKTTLASMVARQMSEDFNGRVVVWINAHQHLNFGLSTMLDIIAARLGRGDLRAYGLEQKKEEISELINLTAPLIILDNFEMIEPDGQKECESWLKDGVSCSALITTRERVDSALNIAIGKISLEAAREFLELLIREEGDDESKAFDGLNHDRIIEAAEYNPLLLRWIVKQIARAQEPEDVLRDLAQGKGDAVERVFDRSFNLPQVGDDGRDVLLAFAPFAITATRQALAAVAGFGDDVNRLNQAVKKLSDLWLIETTERNERLFVRGLTRECIKQRLDESGRADEFYQRFIEHFLKYAEEHAQHSDEDFRALEAEKGNGSNAINRAFERNDWKSVIKFFLAFREFLDQHWYWSDLIDLTEKALIAVQRATKEGLTTRDSELNQLIKQTPAIIGIDHQNRDLARGTYAEALRYYKPKWQEARKGSKKRKKYAYYMGVTLHQMGVLRHYEGDLTRARWWYKWSLRFREECHSLRGIAAVSNNLAVIAEQEGNREEAIGLLHKAHDTFEKQKSPYAEIARRNLERLEGESSPIL